MVRTVRRAIPPAPGQMQELVGKLSTVTRATVEWTALIAYGVLGIGLVDDLLRPVLVGPDAINPKRSRPPSIVRFFVLCATARSAA